jgi:hypothetical protein
MLKFPSNLIDNASHLKVYVSHPLKALLASAFNTPICFDTNKVFDQNIHSLTFSSPDVVFPDRKSPDMV